MSHWIVAPVLLPAVLAALLTLSMRTNPALQRVFSLAGCVALLAIALGLAVAAAGGGISVYELGNWAAPFGIVLVLDRLSALMVLLTAALALVVLLYAIGSGWDQRGAQFPRAVAVPADGDLRRVPDRRRLQPVRVLRGAAHRLLRADDPRGRRAPAQGGRAIRDLQPARLDAVPVRARHALRGHRHAQHGRSGRPRRRDPRERQRAAAGGRDAPVSGVRGQGGASCRCISGCRRPMPRRRRRWRRSLPS